MVFDWPDRHPHDREFTKPGQRRGVKPGGADRAFPRLKRALCKMVLADILESVAEQTSFVNAQIRVRGQAVRARPRAPPRETQRADLRMTKSVMCGAIHQPPPGLICFADVGCLKAFRMGTDAGQFVERIYQHRVELQILQGVYRPCCIEVLVVGGIRPRKQPSVGFSMASPGRRERRSRTL